MILKMVIAVASAIAGALGGGCDDAVKPACLLK